MPDQQGQCHRTDQQRQQDSVGKDDFHLSMD
jgi:hypothetical protein